MGRWMNKVYSEHGNRSNDALSTPRGGLAAKARAGSGCGYHKCQRRRTSKRVGDLRAAPAPRRGVPHKAPRAPCRARRSCRAEMSTAKRGAAAARCQQHVSINTRRAARGEARQPCTGATGRTPLRAPFCGCTRAANKCWRHTKSNAPRCKLPHESNAPRPAGAAGCHTNRTRPARAGTDRQCSRRCACRVLASSRALRRSTPSCSTGAAAPHM